MNQTVSIMVMAAFVIATMGVTNIQMAAGSDQAIVKIHSNTKWLGRRFIGIEIDKDYFAIAMAKLNEAQKFSQ